MKIASRIFLNGTIVPRAKARVSVLDRGFLYGDGVYETVRVYQGKFFRMEHHLKRLDRSLKGIRMRVPWSHSYLTRACNALLKANGLTDCAVRITISRGTGEIGLDPSACANPTLMILASFVRPDLEHLWEQGVGIILAKSVRRNHVKSMNPAIKHINCLNSILAKMESVKAGTFESVLLNLDGYIAEGTISNIFIVKNGVLFTPALDCGLLDGVTRNAIIGTAGKLGITVRQTRIRPEKLFQADEAFLTSTTLEVMPIVKADGKTIGNGRPSPVSRMIQKGYRDNIGKESGITLAALPFEKLT